MKKVSAIFLFAALCFATFSTGAFAKDIAGVTIPDTFRVDGADLVLNGAGIRTKVFFQVYAGALYVETKSSDAAALIEQDKPMAIRLHFLMDVDKKSIIDAWNEGFRNSAGASLSSLSDSIATFNACFSENSKKGTIYDIIYVPGQGVSVSLNGAKKTTIPGLEFKKAAFGIWLGSKPADNDLKKGMLGTK